ncbi:LysR substrate-binding domain-containing protein [Xanthomonas axonopodis]|uniref:LysR substrate-binding domain-containing protein n=1 Tax=Xanthomonas axonopodis TaxID=53413 RepID=UPI003558E74D
MSFSKAAEELCVSTGAVSRHISVLEDFLGQKLFERLTRKVELTPFGATYFAAAKSSFEQIEAVTREALRGHDRLTIDAMPTTANLCLLPWMLSFTEESQIDVHVLSSMSPVDFSNSPADLAIRVGELPGEEDARALGRIPHAMVSNWASVRAEHLWDEVLVPVCSKQYLKDHPTATDPTKWTGDDLIRTVSRAGLWDEWFLEQGLGNAPMGAGSQVAHFYVALQMARKHRGIALVPTVHLNAVEWRGELVCPCPGSMKSVGGFYVLYRDADRNAKRIKTFLTWVRSQGDFSIPRPASGANNLMARIAVAPEHVRKPGGKHR